MVPRADYSTRQQRVAKAGRDAWKRVACCLLLVLLTLALIGCRGSSFTTATSPKFMLLPVVRQGGDPSGRLWGYVDAEGNVTIQPQFQDAGQFSEGLAPVELAGRWGYIGETGSMVIEPQFTEAYSFSEGVARVATRPVLPGHHLVTASGYGFIDKTGHMIIPPDWDGAGGFSEGRAAVMKGSKCGFIDTQGEVVIPLEFDLVGPFSEGLAQASVGEKCGYIDMNGDWAIEPVYLACEPLRGMLDDRYTHFLGGRFKNGLAPVYTGGNYLLGGTCQYIDQAGKQAFPQVFQRGGEFSEGLAPVCVGDRWGFIDTSGSMVIEAQFTGVGSEDFFLSPRQGFHDGLAPVGIDGRVGYINRAGTMVVPPRYAYGFGFKDGFAHVVSETLVVPYGIIDTTGRLIYGQ